MRTKIVHRIFLLLSIGWMIFIFCMSAAPADDSSEMSLDVGMTVGRIFVPGFEEKSAAEQLAFAEKIDHPVRKTAHATEYAVLGGLLTVVLQTGKRKRNVNKKNSEKENPEKAISEKKNLEKKNADRQDTEKGSSDRKISSKIIFYTKASDEKDSDARTNLKVAFTALALSAAYACTDEFHQLFVPGRSGQITDVLIDSAGALCGVILLTIIFWRRRKRKNFIQNHKS